MQKGGDSLPKSMTGYSRVQKIFEEKYRISCELRSLNSKHLTLDLQIPPFLTPYEVDLVQIIKRKLTRGKVQLKVFVEFLYPVSGVKIDMGLARAYYNALDSLVGHLGIPEPVNLDNLLRFKELVRFELKEEESDKVWQGVREIVSKGLDDLNKERSVEGEKLVSDLKVIILSIHEIIQFFKTNLKAVQVELREKYFNNVKEFLSESTEVDESLLENIVAVALEKADVREELTRLESHIERVRDLFNSNEAVGQHLDFLAQEILREFNTILAKSRETSFIEQALQGKLLTSQFREQIQNLE